VSIARITGSPAGTTASSGPVPGSRRDRIILTGCRA
jgi:hypothetical protein